MIKFQQT